MLAMAAVASARERPPIIDMHLHAHRLADYGGGPSVCMNDEPMEFHSPPYGHPITVESVMACAHPVTPAASDEGVMRESLGLLEQYNITAITSGSLDMVERWQKVAPRRVVRAISFLTDDKRTPEELREMFRAGRFKVFAEIGAQYRGLSLDDPSLEPYFELAEQEGIPVGVHLGEGPPGGVHVGGNPDYRVSLGHPLQLEPVLLRHPQLRLYVMHFGSPFVDEMIALMYSHPQVYIDIAQNDWGFPRAHFYSQLARFMDAGFGKRILWGSDQMVWPRAIAVAMETLEKAPFLTRAQKRDIFYNNAVRFLGGDPASSRTLE